MRTFAAALLALALALLGAAGHHGAAREPAGVAADRGHHAHTHPDERSPQDNRTPHAPGHGECPLCVLAHALAPPPFAGVARVLEPGAALRPAIRPAPRSPARLAWSPPARGPPRRLIA